MARLPFANISDVIIAFIDQELMPKANELQKFTTTFVGMAIARQARSMIEANIDKYKFIGIADDESLDIDLTRDLAKEAFEKSGPLNVGGVIINKDDVSTIYNIAKKYSKE